jgi:hypothetical protein
MRKIEWSLLENNILCPDVLLSSRDIYKLFLLLYRLFGVGCVNRHWTAELLGTPKSELVVLCLKREEFENSGYRWYYMFENGGSLIIKEKSDLFYFKLLGD